MLPATIAQKTQRSILHPPLQKWSSAQNPVSDIYWKHHPESGRGEIMNRKPSSGEKELREAIRKLVREELQHLLRERRSRTGKPADSSIPRTSSAAELYPPGHADRPWAVFGVPRPDPEKHPVFPRGKPNTLPGWPEPFHPDFTGFDSPPYLPRKMNK
jgi:hypothetical protein